MSDRPHETHSEDAVEADGAPTDAVTDEVRADAAEAESRGDTEERVAAESLDGDAPAGVRRPANLEDAFVALTGENIE